MGVLGVRGWRALVVELVSGLVGEPESEGMIDFRVRGVAMLWRGGYCGRLC